MKKILLFVLFLIGNIAYSQGPNSVEINIISPNGGDYWTVGSFPRITWESNNVQIITIELSYDGGISWQNIVPFTIAVNGYYDKWKIPNIVSDECRIKISKYDSLEVFDISENNFKIVNNDSLQTKIVVIGSSTAAGVGPSEPDSAWVNRYRNYLYGRNTTTSVINLAVGGYTTYELMPDDFIPPVGRPSPSKSHNITKAISYSPEGIIINLPSNDVTRGFSIEEQLANYDTMLSRAFQYSIPVWISTTQPRNLNDTKRLIQIEMRDSTFSHFGDFAIDFWSGLANDDGTIKSIFNSGDGIHLNNAGHRILFNRVVDANVYEKTIFPTSAKYISGKLPSEFYLAQNYPNPFNPATTIQFGLPERTNAKLIVYDILGREVETLLNKQLNAGIHTVNWDANNFVSGTYFYVIFTNKFVQSQRMILLK